jgi:hypothetical protein
MYSLFALLVHTLIDYMERRRAESVSRDLYEADQPAQATREPQ